MSAGEAAALVALGAVAFLDQWPALQSMVSRPIVVGPLVGAILGAPADGVLWGAVFETVALAVPPVGAARYPDAALAGLLGTVAAIAGAGDGDYPAAWALLVAALAGVGGDGVGRLHRRWNARTAMAVSAGVARGELGAPGRGIAVALARGASLGALQTAVGLSLVVPIGSQLAGSPWSGPLDASGIRIGAAAMAAIAGARVLGLGRRGWAVASAGALAAFAVVAWGSP